MKKNSHHDEQPKPGAPATPPSESESMKAVKGLPVSDKFYIQNIQFRINQFPWELVEKQPVKVQVTQKLDQQTTNAIAQLKEVGKTLNNETLLESVNSIESGNLRDGASLLFDAIQEVQKIMRQEAKHSQQTGKKIWTFQEKLQYLNTTNYPRYFPRPWQPVNQGRLVSGGTQAGSVCGPWMPYEKFRTCQTPYYNHFLMWGPDCPGCGVNAFDTRRARIKRKYPEVFTYEKMRERMKNHIWDPVVPSPGISPYVAPPPAGTPYYKNPRDPHPETEGVRFFDEEDERLYREYEKAYADFKEKEGNKAETLAYNQKFFEQYPHKQVPGRAKSPNEWSNAFYGRENPLWPDGTPRPPPHVLKERIKQLKLKAFNEPYDEILKLAKFFEGL